MSYYIYTDNLPNVASGNQKPHPAVQGQAYARELIVDLSARMTVSHCQATVIWPQPTTHTDLLRPPRAQSTCPILTRTTPEQDNPDPSLQVSFLFG